MAIERRLADDRPQRFGAVKRPGEPVEEQEAAPGNEDQPTNDVPPCECVSSRGE